MEEAASPKSSIGQRLGHELRRYAEISVYLYLCFGALTLYKVAILHGHGISYAPFGFAAVKALILGKFMLIGEQARIGSRYRGGTLIHLILYRSVLFVLLLVVLSIAEEVLAGLIHHRAIADSLAEIGGGTLFEALATALLLLLILIPYLAYRVIGETLGERSLFRLLSERHPAETSERT